MTNSCRMHFCVLFWSSEWEIVVIHGEPFSGCLSAAHMAGEMDCPLALSHPTTAHGVENVSCHRCQMREKGSSPAEVNEMEEFPEWNFIIDERPG